MNRGSQPLWWCGVCTCLRIKKSNMEILHVSDCRLAPDLLFAYAYDDVH